MPDPLLFLAFPGLADDDPLVAESADPNYNCVAWAVGVTDAWWWPCEADAHWPEGVADVLSLEAMVAALGTEGYLPCPDGVPEDGFEKAAIYCRNQLPTHVARQLANGRWSSKLGRDCLVSHATPGGVESAVYGRVELYLRRLRRSD